MFWHPLQIPDHVSFMIIKINRIQECCQVDLARRAAMKPFLHQTSTALILLLHIMDILPSTSRWLLAPFTPFAVTETPFRSVTETALCCRPYVVCLIITCFPEEGKETGCWCLPPGNYVTPPAEEAASSCSQRDSPSPLPDTRLRRSPALRSLALFPFFMPSPHRPAAQQWRPWAALSRLEENFWGRITKRSVSRGEMTRLWLMSFTPTRRLPAGLALCRHIRQVLCVKICPVSLNTYIIAEKYHYLGPVTFQNLVQSCLTSLNCQEQS